jgi:DNA (cytosine-5)-methyltransferase 1
MALDLFCGAGGATKGLQRAGFHVTGVDIHRQPRYCGDAFVQADALKPPFNVASFDFIWASPPCQDYGTMKGLAKYKRGRLIAPVREMLRTAGKPYVIENVVGSELRDWFCLCGSAFDLGVWRHRRFEMSRPPVFTPQCAHWRCPKPVDVTGTGGPFNGVRTTPGGGVSRKPKNLAQAREVMGIGWMTRKELNEAIPPAYAEFIGRAALEAIGGTR